MVRPNIQKKIADICMRYYAVRKGTVFIKGIYISGNSRMAELVRPNIPKKIVDVRAWDDIMHKVHIGNLSKESILQGTHARPNWFARTSKRK